MAGNKHATALSLDNEEMSAFATKRRNPADRLELLKSTLDEASVRPDVRPKEQAAGAPVPAVQFSSAPAATAPTQEASVQPAYVAPRIEQPVQQEAPAPAAHFQPASARMPEPPQFQPQQQERMHAPALRQDEMSYALDRRDEGTNRGGRPKHGLERKVEKTISMDKSLDKMLTRLGIVESVRLDRKVSAAEVAVHLMQYALSHMKSQQVLPGHDGQGLVINGDAPTEVALPMLGGEQ
ncbi:hypothetical protein G6L37_04030 [Agrobacterium rubi]|nr:hypothetical protein [Agrobacterium rubi]NTF24519.1 hypothetical protein [Agrobacterium rubi]